MMYDFLKDKGSFMWRIGDMPLLPTKMTLAAISCYFGCVFSYPFAVTIREMVDFWPKERDGRCTWNNNYRKAAVWMWYHEFMNTFYPGFFNNYFWKAFPQLFLTVMIADKFGIFNYQTIDNQIGAGSNSWEDSFA